MLGLDKTILLDEVFLDGIPHSLDHCTFNLTLNLQRVDRLTHIVGRDNLLQAHNTGIGIDFDCYSLGNIPISKIRLGFSGLWIERGGSRRFILVGGDSRSLFGFPFQPERPPRRL